MSSSPEISVITPTHNRGKALERAIESVRGQSFENYEHIIIDDASTDNTPEIVAKFNDPRIRFLQFKQWRGANPARNEGIAMTRAPIVTFLDSDDEFLPLRLERTLKLFHTHPDTKLLISSFQTWKDDEILNSSNPGGEIDPFLLEHALMSHALFIGSTALTVRRDLLIQIDCFDPNLLRMQDRELLLRISRHSGAISLSEDDWIKHRSHDSISNPRHGYIAALDAMLKKHPELVQRHRELVSYLVARQILKDLMRLHLGLVRESLRANRQSPLFQFSILELIQGYPRGKALRRKISSKLQALEAG